MARLLMALLKLAVASRVLGRIASDITGSGTLMDVMAYLRAEVVGLRLLVRPSRVYDFASMC